MKKIILIFVVLLLSGCAEHKEKSQITDDTNVSAVTENPQTQLTTVTEVIKLTPIEAKAFAENLLKKINDDEKFINDAYALKEQNTLEKYFYDNQSYKFPDPENYQNSYWKDPEALAPYTKCSTALDDLQLYANALKNKLREDTATMRKIARQEKEDYEKSKAQCERRAKLTYEQALTEDNSE